MSNTNEQRPSPDSTQPAVPPAKSFDKKVDQLQQWNVVLMKDQDHSYNYVTSMLRDLFKLPAAKAVEVASKLDRQGRAVCMTSHKEHAEFKREQVLGYGRDTLVDRSSGSMNAVLELTQ
ncbi:MAG TPA: ATP-dependent Clp protease adaptor ClpS [Phycisphaerales bacterium]|nr:ATP-dependent Clp protease adaptor ClpS [Phycisphaerales bacterium]